MLCIIFIVLTIYLLNNEPLSISMHDQDKKHLLFKGPRTHINSGLSNHHNPKILIIFIEFKKNKNQIT